MKKILFILLWLIFSASGVEASEIFGLISTDPNLLKHSTGTAPLASSPLANLDDELTVPNESGGSGLIFQKLSKASGTSETSGKGNVKVLGIKYYPDNSLLRDSSKRIYFIKSKAKKPIHNLKELAKYRGQVIYEATFEELAIYPTRGHLDGDLIREKGDIKVYVLRNSIKKHILNLDELRISFFGQQIFNISREEMNLY
jgi:hypothetical protein